MDVRAKRVSAALSVPRRVVSIEVTKDKGRRGRRQKRRVKPRGTRRVGRRVNIKKRERTIVEVNLDPKKVRDRIRGGKRAKGPRRVCNTIANKRQNTPTPTTTEGSGRI